MDKKDKKKKNLSFVESVANDEQFQPVSLDELEEDTNTTDKNEVNPDGAQEDTDTADKNEVNPDEAQDDKETLIETSTEADGNKSTPSPSSETESKGDEQKGKKSLLEILDKKPEGPVKAIPVPTTIHSKIASLSGITEYGISDITASVLNHFLIEYKPEILKMLKRQTQNEWK